MSVEEQFRAGNLRAAIDEQITVVRAQPTDADARYLLFVLFCFAGELERAEKALDVLPEIDSELQTKTVIYQNLLMSDHERMKVYEGAAVPTLHPDAPSWAKDRLHALQILREGDAATAEKHIDEAVGSTPDIAGTLNGEPFEAFRDYDDILGSIIEVYAGGRYLWMPISQIHSLELKAPETALDLLWRQARLVDSDGDAADVHVPVLYARSYASENDAIRLGRITDWSEDGELYTGRGAHVFLTLRGGERHEDALLDVASITFETT